MTTEQAIRWFESGMWQQDLTTTMAVGMALAALRAQQEREKGCEYCNRYNTLNESSNQTDIWNGNTLAVGYGVYRTINFCPMCGRKLEPKEVSE
jgi:hypothetical protein